ncbi:MAG TPA: hypothetical protein VFU47_16535, partial [Armatimonadota bacterium]|nr:hypothetical protein [Armatimonadota bacterium]
YDAAAGAFSPPVLTRPGALSYVFLDDENPPRNRWGDYSDCALDVASGTNVWIQGQLPASTTTWKLFAARLTSTPSSAPDPPFNLRAAVQAGPRVALQWVDNSADETGFELERKVGAGSFAPLAAVPPNATQFTDDTVGENTAAAYRVRATGALVPSAFSNEAAAVTPLNAPTGLKVTPVSPVRLRLDWTDNSAAEGGFTIERRTARTPFAVVGTVGADVVTFTDAPLSASTTYTYRVRAVGGLLPSAPSSEASGATPVPGKLKLAPSPVAFGKSRLGVPVTRVLRVKNTGRGLLTVTLGAPSAPFSIPAGGGTFSLARNQVRRVTLQFTPSAAGPTRGVLPITTDDPARLSVTLRLTGTGRPL